MKTTALTEKRTVKALQLLGDDSRFKMFKILLEAKEPCVSEIADRLGISAPAVSQHFRLFELVGLVNRNRSGQKICYELRLDDPLVTKLTALIS